MLSCVYALQPPRLGDYIENIQHTFMLELIEKITLFCLLTWRYDKQPLAGTSPLWNVFSWFQMCSSLKFRCRMVLYVLFVTDIKTLVFHCMARQCSPLRRKFMECSINSPALSLLMTHLVIGERSKTPNFSAFHWSPRGSLVSIGQNFVATRVVHLPKSTETSLITESDQSGPNYQLLNLCTAHIAWSESDQGVRAVHSCISWFLNIF